MKVFTAQQMRDFDKSAIEDYGIPSIVLMENAALRVVEFLEAKFAPLREKNILILCGKGNNGGDGLAIARHLLRVPCEGTKVYLFGEFDQLEGDAQSNLKIVSKEILWDAEEVKNVGVAQKHHEVMSADLIIDCVSGTGFTGELRQPLIDLFPQFYGSICSSSANVVCVDLPTGLDANSGIKAKYTGFKRSSIVTFVGPKRGFFVRDGLESCKEVWVGEIGTSLAQSQQHQTGAQTLDLETAKQFLPYRPLDAHKGDAGRALIVGGSFGMSGSICLASKAALAVGAGLVSAALPKDVLPIFADAVLEAVSHPLPNDDSGHLLSRAADDVAALWEKMQVVALGPGLGRTDEAFEFARRVARECPAPLVIDADALHALPAIADAVKARKAPTILTPHPGEMGVLMDSNAKDVNNARFDFVADCADKYGAITVLKGARTLVCDSSGEIWVNLSGHPGMATGGAGDVLTGTIAGLLAQLKDADNAAKLGVYLHGLAGEIAARTRGNGLVAGDIAAHLPDALLEIETREVERINGRLRKLE